MTAPRGSFESKESLSIVGSNITALMSSDQPLVVSDLVNRFMAEDNLKLIGNCAIEIPEIDGN